MSLRQTRRKRSGFALRPSLCLATALLLASTPLATRGQSLHQLYHRSWTVREGAPSSITSFAQTDDGFHWAARLTPVSRSSAALSFELATTSDRGIESVSVIRDNPQVTNGNFLRGVGVPIGILHHVEDLAVANCLHPIMEQFRFPNSAPAS